MAGQLYIVSNRVTVPSGRAAAGGLAVGVLAALRDKGGVWFGWSGDSSIPPTIAGCNSLSAGR